MPFPDTKSRSAILNQRARIVLPNGNSRSSVNLDPYPPYLSEAHGAEIIDVDGNRFIDFNHNMTSLIHGNSYEPITDAINEQLSKGTAVSMATEIEIHLAELLCERVPSFEKVRFMNSGTEAVMNLIKAARAFTGRPKVARIEGAYHGSYDFAEVGIANSVKDRDETGLIPRALCAGTPASVLNEVVVLPLNETALMEKIIEQEAGSLACIIIDPMPLNLSMVTLQDSYLESLRRATAKHGILLCFDEVISLRNSYAGAQGALGVEPDLTAIGKIIGGGFPVGAVAGRADVMDVFSDQNGRYAKVTHGGTFNANPITMTAGLVAMKDMSQLRFQALNQKGADLRSDLNVIFKEMGTEAQVLGHGSLFNVRFNTREMSTLQDLQVNKTEMTKTSFFQQWLIGNGMWMFRGLAGCLSTATTDAQINQFLDVIKAGLIEEEFRAA